jgi:iron-sulfur cluster assembly protein
LTLDESKTGDDILDQGFGVSLLTDKKLSTYLEGATVDFIESKNGGGFEIRTVKTAGGSSCGDSCGGSCS